MTMPYDKFIIRQIERLCDEEEERIGEKLTNDTDSEMDWGRLDMVSRIRSIIKGEYYDDGDDGT